MWRTWKKLYLILGCHLSDLIFVYVRRPPCTAKTMCGNLAEHTSGTQGTAPFLLRNGAQSLTCIVLELLMCICICCSSWVDVCRKWWLFIQRFWMTTVNWMQDRMHLLCFACPLSWIIPHKQLLNTTLAHTADLELFWCCCSGSWQRTKEHDTELQMGLFCAKGCSQREVGAQAS